LESIIDLILGYNKSNIRLIFKGTSEIRARRGSPRKKKVKKMKKPNRITLLTAILVITISLAATTSIAFATVDNYNPYAGQVTTSAPEYMTADNTAAAAAATYGNLLNESYNWENPHGGDLYRTGFNLGPAPDRPDVLFTTTTGQSIPKVWMGSTQATDRKSVV
jgi:hypothetical protein